MRSLWFVLALVVGCGDDGGGGSTSGDSGTDGATCSRQAPAADRTRFVVVSHPYGAGSTQSDAWEVLDLSPSGAVSRPGRTFTMGRAIVGKVAFTVDAKVGIAAQDDGTLGVFTLDDAGTPTVTHARYTGDFYADSVITAPDGALYVLDNQWRENGGGIYRLTIDCAGTITGSDLVAAARLPAGLAFVPNTTRALLAANDIGSSLAGNEAHLLEWTGGVPTVSASTDLFADDMAIIGGTALTHDGAYFLAGDTSAFGTEPNRVAVAALAGTSFGAVEMIPDVEDPIALLADPDRLQVLAVSGFGNAMFVLAKPASTWTKTEVTYMGGRPQLPGGAVLLAAGTLRGHAYIAENTGVRHVRFTATGVEDLGEFSLGDGVENGTGAIGVTP